MLPAPLATNRVLIQAGCQSPGPEGVGSRPPEGGKVTRQDPQDSFPSCQESGMCSPILSHLRLGKYSAENKHPHSGLREMSRTL